MGGGEIYDAIKNNITCRWWNQRGWKAMLREISRLRNDQRNWTWNNVPCEPCNANSVINATHFPRSFYETALSIIFYRSSRCNQARLMAVERVLRSRRGEVANFFPWSFDTSFFTGLYTAFENLIKNSILSMTFLWSCTPIYDADFWKFVTFFNVSRFLWIAVYVYTIQLVWSYTWVIYEEYVDTPITTGPEERHYPTQQLNFPGKCLNVANVNCS